MPNEDDNRTISTGSRTFHRWRDFSDSLHHVRSEEATIEERPSLRGHPIGTRGSTLVMDEAEGIPMEFPIPETPVFTRTTIGSREEESRRIEPREEMARFQRIYEGNTNTYMLGEDEMSINGFKVVETIKLLQKKVAEQDAYIKLLLKDEEPV